MKKLFVAAAAASAALAAPAVAAPTFDVSGGSFVAIPGNNDFQSDLAGLLLFNELVGANVTLPEEGIITFELLGSESAFSDTFSFGGYSYTETSVLENHFASPINLGSFYSALGAFAAQFTSDGAGSRSGSSGTDAFAVFVGRGEAADYASFSTNVLYFGYDDSANVDDNHDDFIIKATIAPVPEPATWAMMVGGIAAMGMVMRRRSQTARVSFS